MNEQLVSSIKSKGHWRINLRPIDSSALNSLSLEECLEVVRRAEVELRGWNYPHLPRREGDDTGIRRMGTYVEAWIDWMSHREFWRMYNSSQFLHYRALNEDWFERENWGGGSITPNRRGEPIEGPVLGVISNLWLLVEVFEFASRLHQQCSLYTTGVDISVQLHHGTVGTERTLWVDDQMRVPFSYPRKSGAPVLSYEKTLAPAEIDDPKSQAATAAMFFFDKFGWTPAADQLMKDIDKLYNL